MIIEIHAHGNGAHSTRIRSAVSLLNGVQRHFHFRFCEDDRLIATGRTIDPESKCRECEAVIGDNPFILITEDPLEDNWFSHEYRRSSIITVCDWEREYAPPSLRTYLIYQIAQSTVSFAADLTEEMGLNLVHEPPKACMFDMSVQKSDIKFGMLAGNLCPQCEGTLKTLGTSGEAIDAVRHMVGLVRAEAIGMPILLDPGYAFVVMRFTSNDENDNAWRYGIKTGLERGGFNAVRADSHVESGQILAKISSHISKSRLVIVKVDENNLNVYFELGLAMGMNKDVLLVSESSLVLSLPSDLRNWECLTYNKGDYDQLRDKLHMFLKHTYGDYGM